MSHPCISRLDTERFGFPIAQITDFETYPPAPTIEQLRLAGCKLVIARLPLAHVAMINRLENLGFRIKDTQLTYRYDMVRNKPVFDEVFSPQVSIVNYEPRHKENIIALTAESFAGYGHYFADERLDKTRCLEVYTDWAKRCCEDPKLVDVIFVAEVDGKMASYGSYKKENGPDGPYLAGVVGAVSQHYRNLGVFRMIVAKGILWGAAQNLPWYEHNVLAVNYPVNSLLISLGCRIHYSFATLHLWI